MNKKYIFFLTAIIWILIFAGNYEYIVKKGSVIVSHVATNDVVNRNIGNLINYMKTHIKENNISQEFDEEAGYFSKEIGIKIEDNLTKLDKFVLQLNPEILNGTIAQPPRTEDKPKEFANKDETEGRSMDKPKMEASMDNIWEKDKPKEREERIGEKDTPKKDEYKNGEKDKPKESNDIIGENNKLKESEEKIGEKEKPKESNDRIGEKEKLRESEDKIGEKDKPKEYDIKDKPNGYDEESKKEMKSQNNETLEQTDEPSPSSNRSNLNGTQEKRLPVPVGTVHEFPYMIFNQTLCKGTNLTYLIYVHTAPQNFERRLQLRETWGMNSVVPQYESRIIFMLANPHDDKIQEKLYEESKIYGDLIQEDFVDSYKNLTQKAVGALKWISLYCGEVKFVIKTDDDVFLDIFRVLKLMKDKYWDAKRYILGLLYSDNSMPILRDPKTCMKWCVKESEFKGNYYPKYMSGGFLILSGDIITEMYLASKRTPFFWVDDVYLTGLLPMKLENIAYHSIAQYYQYFQGAYDKVQFDPSNPKKFFGTLTNNKRYFWLKTLQNISDEDKSLLGNKYYSDLLAEADRIFKKEKQIS